MVINAEIQTHSEPRRIMLVQHRMSLIVAGRGIPSRVSLAEKIGRFLLASLQHVNRRAYRSL